MAVTPVSNGTNSNGTVKSKSTLNSSDFIKLMITQLANQNPLEPVKDTEYYAQLAQLGTVQGIEGMQAALEGSQATNYLGRTVTANVKSVSGTTSFTGTATRVNKSNGKQEITLTDANGDTRSVQVADITSVA